MHYELRDGTPLSFVNARTGVLKVAANELVLLLLEPLLIHGDDSLHSPRLIGVHQLSMVVPWAVMWWVSVVSFLLSMDVGR